jgi:hypothetical protein
VNLEQVGFCAGGVFVGGLWLARKIKRSLWKVCPKCKGTNRGGRGLLGSYEHCGNCDGGEVPSVIGRFFRVGVRR